MTKKSPNPQIHADHPEIEFEIAYDVVNFPKFHDVTSNFQLDFQAIG